jgi:hypothetical protein
MTLAIQTLQLDITTTATTTESSVVIVQASSMSNNTKNSTGVDEANVVDPNKNTATNDDDVSAVVSLPPSPLNVCGWKGLICSHADQKVVSLVWSKCYCDLPATANAAIVLAFGELRFSFRTQVNQK